MAFIRIALASKTPFILCAKRGIGQAPLLINRHGQLIARNNFLVGRENLWLQAKHTSTKTAGGTGSTSVKPKSRILHYYKVTQNRFGAWIPLPLAVVITILLYRRFTQDRTAEPKTARDWEINCYRTFPLRSLSRLWGWMHTLNLPTWSRKPLLSLYVWVFNCNVSEAEVEDLSQYKNLGEFFRRSLKEGARPIDPNSHIVSPSDGKVLHFGKVSCGEIEQVKGVSYSLPEFLGPPSWASNYRSGSKCADPNDPSLMSDCEKYSKCISHKDGGTSLYHIVIYLAPGDYHKFHSPAEWQCNFRRHFVGDLLSVNPKVANLVRGLFNFNERAVYVGTWEHGFFSYAAIGATNVGSIKIYNDDRLLTNEWRDKKGIQFDKSFPQPLTYKKGDPFGEFNLGSTIVLIFEAPCNFQFNVEPGHIIKVGQPFITEKSDTNNNKSKSTSDDST